MKNFFNDLFELISFVQIPRSNKRIVFYSEGRDTWIHLEGIIEELLKITNLDVCYISSEKKDPGLNLKKKLDKLNIEVQFVKFKHNLNERKLVYDFCNSIGIKKISEINGSLTNYTDYNFNMKMIEEVMDNSLFPKCFWPFFSIL